MVRKVLVKNMHGLHMRVASKIVKACAQQDAHVFLCKGCERANGCSMMEMLLLGAAHGSELEVIVCGKSAEEEERAYQAVADIVEDGAGI